MENKKTLNKIFSISITVQTILMGVFFILQILRIYYGNNSTFTRSICKQYLLQILPIIIIWLILVVFSSIYFQNKKNNDIAKITNIAKLTNLEIICPDYQNNMDSEYILLKTEKQRRKKGLIICLIITLICSIMGLMYLVNPKHFVSSGNLIEQAIQMSIHLLPWCIIAFASFIIYTYYEEKSAKKSLDIIKTIIKANGKKQNKIIKNNDKKIKILQTSITILAIVLIVIGAVNGEYNSVLHKAINICTECIGLG